MLLSLKSGCKMKTNKLNKLFSYSSLSTAIRNCNGDNELITAVKKHFSRLEKTVPSVKDFTDSIIKSKLSTIAKNMPDDGYSMGSNIRVLFSKLVGNYSTCQEYANSSRFKAIHGGYFVKLTADEYRNISVIGGLVTYIYPNQKGSVKKCWWYSSAGSKQHFRLLKTEGYVFKGYHDLTKENIIAGGNRAERIAKQQAREAKERERAEKLKNEAFKKLYNKALRRQYSFEDSIKCGNCESGSRAFVLRLRLDSNRKYRGSFLLKQAEQKSTSSVHYVKRMISYFAR